MKLLLTILCFGFALQAEDLLSRQSGLAIPPGVWTQITPVGGPFFPTYQSYDNFAYSPVTGRTYLLGTFKDITSETDRTLFGYSGEKNRWDLIDQGSTSHDEHMLEGGHSDNRMVADPTTGFLWLLNGGGSGSNAAEFTFANWQYDPVGQAGRVTRSILRTFGASAEYSARVDYIRGVILQHGTSQGTQEYNMLNNTWGAAYCGSGGPGCPPPAVQEACMVWNTAHQSMYLFGGFNNGVAQNTLYRNSAGTWSVVTPSGTGPSPRAWPGCGYDTKHNKLLVFGGCTSGSGCSTGNLSDTYILDFATNTWSAGPAGPPAPAAGHHVTEKLVYDERMDAFIMGVANGGPYQLWALRLYAGQKFGYSTGETYSMAPGNISVSPLAWAKKPWVTVNGATVSVGWDETGIPSDTSNSQYEHPVAANIQTGSPVFLPSPAAYNAMMPLVGSAPSVSNDVSCAYVGETLWCSWVPHNISNVVYTIYAGSYNGTAWTSSPIGVVNAGGGVAAQGHSVMLNVNGVPTVIFQEVDKIIGSPYRNFVYAKQCTGGPPCTWGAPLGGTFLNRTNSTSPFLPVAESIAAAYKSGGDFFVAWSEYNASSSQQSDSPPNVYVSCWCAAAWVKYGGSVNVLPGTTNPGNPPSPPNTGSSANQPAIRFIGGQPYVALVERTNLNPAGVQKLYIRTTANAGTTWTTVAGPLNIDPKFGWATTPAMTDDGGSNLIVTWAEQAAGAPWTAAVSNLVGAFGSKPRIYAAQVTTGGAVTRLGGTLNASLNGAAVSPRIDMASGAPVVVWSELTLGTMRQVYAKLWNGSAWNALGSGALAVTTGSLPATTVGATYSQFFAGSGGVTPYTWSTTAGTLPAGLTLNPSNGAIAGTLTTAAISTFTVQVTDSAAATATKAFSISVNAAPVVTTASPLPGGTTGAAYSQTLANSGGTAPFTWSATSGTLPAGLTLASTTGALGGTAQTGAVANFTARILDSAGIAASKAFAITIGSNLAVTTATPMTAGTASGAYSQTLAAAGGFGADSWTVTAGTLPAGLTLAASAGIISGTPSSAATSNFTVQAADAGSNLASKALAITINGGGPLITSTSPLDGGAANMPYSETLTSSGGTTPFSWSITAGALPAGLTLAASTGIISGTPTIAAISNFTVRVTDNLGLSGSKDLSITTNPPGEAVLSGSAVVKNRATIH